MKLSGQNKNAKQNTQGLFTKETLLILLQWLPIYAALLILPFIVYYKAYESRLYGENYYTSEIYNYDFSLYHKQIALFYISGAVAVLLGILLFKNRAELKQNFRKQLGILVPLGIYIVFAFLSSVCSEHRYGALTGSDGLFQSFFALLGYALLAVYLYFLIKTEQDVKRFGIAIAIGASMQALLGVLQYAGLDLHAYDWYQNLITPEGYLEAVGPVTNALKDMVSLCANNPNYAGVLLALLASLCFGILLTEKRIRFALGEGVLLLALFIALIGTGSKAGLLVFAVAAIIGIFFLAKKLWSRWYLLFPAAAGIVILFLLIAVFARLPVLENLKTALSIEKEAPNPLSQMITGQDGVEITYQGVTFITSFEFDESTFHLTVRDSSGTEIPLIVSADKQYFLLDHEALGNGAVTMQVGVLGRFPLMSIQLEGREWRFVAGTEEEGYYYVNPYVHFEKLATIERIGFEGYERLATNRGLIWSMTLPLLKETLLLGVGANNFVHLYPQNNYKDVYYYFGNMQVMTKPHNMYLQIAVETGVVSLLALLVFWGWYLLQSVKIYWHSTFQSFSERLGFGCFLAVLTYLGCGLSNDSMITVAPIFWCVLGVGLAVNQRNKTK